MKERNSFNANGLYLLTLAAAGGLPGRRSEISLVLSRNENLASCFELAPGREILCRKIGTGDSGGTDFWQFLAAPLSRVEKNR